VKLSELTAIQSAAQCIIGTMPGLAPKVLVVDDDSNVREVVIRYLEREGSRPSTVSRSAGACGRWPRSL
jgi:PleD family two-component response regulator